MTRSQTQGSSPRTESQPARRGAYLRVADLSRKMLPTPSPSCRAFGPWSASRPLAAVEGVEAREQ